MKTYNTLLLLLTVASLFGCNTLVTKPNVSTTDISHTAANRTTYKNQETDSLVHLYRIDDDIALDLASSNSEGSNQFSTAWVFEEEINSLPGTQGVVSNPFIHQSTEKTGKTSKLIALEAAKKAHKAHKFSKKFDKVDAKKLTENRLNTNQVLANIFTNETVSKNTNKDSQTFVDLWSRIRNGYKLPEVNNYKVQNAIKKYVKNPHYFKRISKKAHPYLYYIVEQIEKRKMPLEIVLLPAIESAYEPMALSYKSAAGLWQFIPATGKGRGLRQNEWYDGRRDIMKSTTAALDYLQSLYKLFDNDWFLALAAYNYGQGNLKKAIKKNEQLSKPTDFWSLSLPRETREYVPKLLALSRIVANPQTFGIKLQAIANKPYLKQVNVGHQIDLSLAAQLASLSRTEFKRLNPSYRRGVTNPKGPHYLLLPVDKVGKFKQRLAKIPAHLFVKKKTQLAQVDIKTQKHRVRRGENLWKIAKRYGTTVAALRQLNHFNNRSLYVGQQLKVQAKALVSKQHQVHTHSAVTPVKTQKHRVRRGENLWQLAKRYGTTISLLRKLNKFKGNSLKIGDFLRVPLLQF
ncbi:LysM peptidoglycan-binding domain-containing protein [Candidatus Parabeggiatoa sp. HSG14]|uniref:LysM peptidoglycan-binding domain-containing protein n=1 Tax=Candidatus Parabeggiatoa sp. HSG14 TaxID=3055593 RepID=UPI0025A916FF|nr:LysM peptidoglycan-binding domain-containing protein [Thiotrichales bacterium HSG14]